MKKLVLAFAVTEDFQRAVSDDLVRIHVGRSPCPTLNHVDGEMFMPFPRDDFVTSRNDRSSPLRLQHRQLAIGTRSGFFHIRQATYEMPKVVQRNPRDRKILHPTQRLHPIVGSVRQFALT